MIHFDSWFGSASDTGCQWPMKVYSSKFILPERETKKALNAVFAWICLRCCIYFFKKVATHYWVLIWGICFYFFAGILRISKIGFIVFVHCFFGISVWIWGCVTRTKRPASPAGCVARRKKQMRSAEDATRGMQFGGPWIKSKVRPQDGAPTTRNKMEGPFPFHGRK